MIDRLPALDGLRAVAVLIVIGSHIVSPIFPGQFGVTLFFFISGFIITRMLLQEQGASLAAFYVRRFFRLYPALLFYVVCSVVAAPLIGRPVEWRHAVAALLFFINYLEPTGVSGFLTHTWSLAIEEHFYLVFPLLVVLLRGRLIWAVAACMVGCLVLRIFALGNASPSQIMGMTHFRVDSIAWGCWVSVMIHRSAEPGFRKVLELMSTPVAVVFGALLLVASFAIRDDTFRLTLRFTCQALAFAIFFIAIFWRGARNWVVSLLEWRALGYIGLISYSLYLWHMFGRMIAYRFGFEIGPMVPIALPITVLTALFSYYFIESPSRRFGVRLAKRIAARSPRGGGAEQARPLPLER